MSKRRPERLSGRILRVWTEPVGTTLAADAAAGATSIAVDDASAFNDDGKGGSLYIGTQTVAYTTVDDDTGTVTLAAPLTAAASTDDDVVAWDTLYGQVDTVQYADVVVDGSDHNFDPVRAVVSDLIADLVDGDRGKSAEACVLERDGDEWELVRVKGRPAKARGRKWEDDDVHVLTAAEVTAGSFTHQLSHVPVDESVRATWRTTPQEPTEFTVTPGGLVSWALSGFEAAGDRFWFHYQYIDTLVAPTVPPQPVLVGTSSVADNGSAIVLPAGVQAGDLIVVGMCAGDSAAGSVSSTDRRLTSSVVLSNAMKVYYGYADGVQDNVSISMTGGYAPTGDSIAVLAVYRDATVTATAKTSSNTSDPMPAAQVADARAAVVVGLDFSNTSAYITGAAPYTTDIQRADTLQHASIFHWGPVAAWQSSPAGMFTPPPTTNAFALVTLRTSA